MLVHGYYTNLIGNFFNCLQAQTESEKNAPSNRNSLLSIYNSLERSVVYKKLSEKQFQNFRSTAVL